MRRRAQEESGFLNIPYDPLYESLYLAFIDGLSGHGLVPRATIEIPTSERRLNRIVRLIRRCRYSFHDLSRIQLDRSPPPTPRFNMPFELGLAVDWSLCAGSRHQWFVFESRPHRLSKSLSDLNGTDPYIHEGTVHGVLRGLMNVLTRTTHRPETHRSPRNLSGLTDSGPRDSSRARRHPFRGARFRRSGSLGATTGSGPNFFSSLLIQSARTHRPL